MNCKLVFAIAGSLLVAACSSENEDKEKVRGDHVWHEQVQTYDRARAVEGQLQDAVQRQKEALDKQAE